MISGFVKGNLMYCFKKLARGRFGDMWKWVNTSKNIFNCAEVNNKEFRKFFIYICSGKK